MLYEYITFKSFKDEFMNNLRTPSCLPTCIEELCGGWSQETYKQVIHKITKKGSNPLPLYFDSYQSMEHMSNKAGALQELFKLVDTRKKGRIDACEVFSFIILIVNGEFENVFHTVVEIFGTEKPNSITRNEMYYFLDSLFRGMFKLTIKKGEKAPKNPDRRLHDEDIKILIRKLFGNDSIQSLLKDEFANNVNADRELQTFFEYITSTMQEALKNAREQAIYNMKTTIELKKLVIELCSKVEKEYNLQNPKK